MVLKDINTVSQIRVGANVSYGLKTMPDLLFNFAGQYPLIPVYTLIGNSRQIEDALLNNELDFGMIDRPLNHKLLVGEFIKNDNLVAVCSLNSSIPAEIKVSDLEQIPVLTREQGSGLRNVIEQLAIDHHIAVNVRIESISIQSLIELCLAGLGILFLPQSLAEPYITSKEMREVAIKDFCFTRTYYLVYHKSKFFTKSMKCFKDYLDVYFKLI